MRRSHLGMILCAAFVLVCTTSLKATDNRAAEKQLKRSLENQVFSLRVPTFSDKLHFDVDGQPLGTSLPAPWTTGGLVEVKEISLKNDSLRIDGDRVLVALRSTKNSSAPPALATVLTDRSVRITLDLDPGSIDLKRIDAALGKMFEHIDFQRRIAAYWTPASSTGADVQPSDTAQVVGTLEGGRSVYKVKAGVVEPPKPLHTPDPDYTEEARQKRLQGTAELMVVVNDNGFPEILELVKGLGDGLDVRALEAISEWRFQPATRKGEPVAVMAVVQMTFKLF
jgi:TonB family protein